MINLLNPDGTYNENAGSYANLDRREVRKRVVADLEAQDLLVKVEPHANRVGLSDRSKTPIEPYLSDQWFVKMDELAQDAMDAVTSGKIAIHPERYARSYLDWLGEKRDWCISRQLWWGHRIPVWRLEITPPDAFGLQSKMRDWERRETEVRAMIDVGKASNADELLAKIERSVIVGTMCVPVRSLRRLRIFSARTSLTESCRRTTTRLCCSSCACRMATLRSRRSWRRLRLRTRSRRPRHLVQLRPLAALDPRLARGDLGTQEVLPDQRPLDGPRHHHPLGRPDGGLRPVQHA